MGIGKCTSALPAASKNIPTGHDDIPRHDMESRAIDLLYSKLTKA